MKKLKIIFLCSVLLIATIISNSPVFASAIEDSQKEKVIVEDIIDDTDLTYSENWDNYGQDSSDPAQSEHWNTRPWVGESYSFSFTGNQFILYGKKAPNHGSFSVKIDGIEVEKKVSQKADKAKKNLNLYESKILEYGEHNVEVTAVEGAIQVEYVKIYREIEEKDCYKEINIESNDITTTNEINKIQYSQGHNWAEGIGSPENYSGGNDYWTNTKGAYYTIRFKGRNIKILGAKSSGFGEYDVLMDGIKIDTINAKNDIRLLKQVLFEKSFNQTEEHEFKVIKNGSGTIEIDNIIVGLEEYVPVENISVYPETVSLGVNQKQTIFPTVKPMNSTTQTIQYRSKNEDIAKVNSEGVVQGLNVGNTVVEVLCGGIITEVPVIVKKDKDIMGTSFAYTGTHTLNEDYQKNKLLNDKAESLVAWKNDEVHTKVAIWSYDEPLNNVKVSSTDLIGEKGTISKNFIDVNFLTEVSAYVGRGNASSKPHENIPEVIDYKDSVNLSSESIASVFVSVKVPENTAAGFYTGTITVTSDEKTEELSYTLEVLDIVYPETKDYTMLELWQSPFSAARYYSSVGKDNYFSEQHLSILRNQLQLYADAGGTSITTSILDEPWGHQTYDDFPSMVKWTKTENGNFSFDYAWFDAYVELCMELGIDKQIKSFSMVPWSNKIVYYDEVNGKNANIKIFETDKNGNWTSEMTSDGEKAWNQFLDSYIAHLDEKGWFDITYIAMDERPMGSMQTAIELIEKHKNKDGKSLKISGAFNHYGSGSYEEILEKTDDVSIGMTAINGKEGMDKFRKWALDRKEKGLLTSVYTCTTHYPNSFTRSNPDESEWVLWFVQSMNADGFLRWSYDSFVKDPYDNIDTGYEAGDPFYVYPDPDENSQNPVVRSTVRFEKMEEGVRNIVKYRYLIENGSNDIREKLQTNIMNIERVNGTVVEGGAEGTPESKMFVTKQVKEMDDLLIECTKSFITENNINEVKKELNTLIFEASKLNEADYTKESWEVFNKAFDMSKQIAVKEGVLKDEIITAIDSLNKAIECLIKKESEEQTNKIALSIAIETAKAVTQEQLDKVVPAVADEFKAALENARNVNAKGNASQEEVDNAFDRLAKAMHMLEFYKGDKALLQKMMDQIANLKASDYTDATWSALQAVLPNVNKVINNVNAMQEEVDEVYTELVKAFINLRLKPNKDLLNDLISKANGINRASFTAASLSIVDAEVETANAVLNDPEATKEAVNNAVNGLTRALSGLEEINPVNPETPVDNSSAVTPVKPGDTTVNSIKTGDTVNMVYPLAGLAIASLCFYGNKKRKIG